MSSMETEVLAKIALSCPSQTVLNHVDDPINEFYMMLFILCDSAETIANLLICDSPILRSSNVKVMSFLLDLLHGFKLTQESYFLLVIHHGSVSIVDV
jgi:hypothetical protein